MKFLSGLSPGIFARFAVISMIAFALLSTGCVDSYASMALTTSAAAKSSPIDYSTSLKADSPTAGPAFVPGRPSTAQHDRSTNFTGYGIRASLATQILSESASAVPIGYRSNSLGNSTTFTSANSATIPASRYGDSLLSDISKTVLPFSDANRATSLRSSERSLAKNLKTLPIDRLRPLFRPPYSGSETGLISERFTRRSSTWRGSLRHWTHGPPNYARSWTGNLSGSPWHKMRSRDSTNWSRANLPRSFTTRR